MNRPLVWIIFWSSLVLLLEAAIFAPQIARWAEDHNLPWRVMAEPNR